MVPSDMMKVPLQPSPNADLSLKSLIGSSQIASESCSSDDSPNGERRKAAQASIDVDR
jgi:hypothetical protein